MEDKTYAFKFIYYGVQMLNSLISIAKKEIKLKSGEKDLTFSWSFINEWDTFMTVGEALIDIHFMESPDWAIIQIEKWLEDAPIKARCSTCIVRGTVVKKPIYVRHKIDLSSMVEVKRK